MNLLQYEYSSPFRKLSNPDLFLNLNATHNQNLNINREEMKNVQIPREFAHISKAYREIFVNLNVTRNQFFNAIGEDMLLSINLKLSKTFINM